MSMTIFEMLAVVGKKHTVGIATMDNCQLFTS